MQTARHTTDWAALLDPNHQNSCTDYIDRDSDEYQDAVKALLDMLKEFKELSLDEAKLFRLLMTAVVDHTARVIDDRQRTMYPY